MEATKSSKKQTGANGGWYGSSFVDTIRQSFINWQLQEVILAVRMHFSGRYRCGEVVVVERLKSVTVWTKNCGRCREVPVAGR